MLCYFERLSSWEKSSLFLLYWLLFSGLRRECRSLRAGKLAQQRKGAFSSSVLYLYLRGELHNRENRSQRHLSSSALLWFCELPTEKQNFCTTVLALRQPEKLNCIVIFCSHQDQQHFKSIAISKSLACQKACSFEVRRKRISWVCH